MLNILERRLREMTMHVEKLLDFYASKFEHSHRSLRIIQFLPLSGLFLPLFEYMQTIETSKTDHGSIVHVLLYAEGLANSVSYCNKVN